MSKMKKKTDAEIINQVFGNYLSYLSDNGYRFKLNGQLDIYEDHNMEYKQVRDLRDRLLRIIGVYE